jgi:hypothetical protein
VELINKKEQMSQRGEDVSRLSAKIDELSGMIEEAATSNSLDSWTKLNERNRRKNLTEGSEAERVARTEKASTSKSGLDPFARIKAVPTHVFVTPNANEEQSPVSPASAGPPSPHATSQANGKNGAQANGTSGKPMNNLFADVDVDIDL